MQEGREKMRDKKLYVCPRCHVWYSCYEGKSPEPCPNCDIPPLPVHVDYSYWKTLSQPEKDECKRKYMQDHQYEMKTSVVRKKTELKPRASTTLVHVMGTLVMLACVCAGIFAGPLGLVVGIIGGLASAAGLWVFAGMAEDLQALRKSVEDLNDTLAQIKREQG